MRARCRQSGLRLVTRAAGCLGIVLGIDCPILGLTPALQSARRLAVVWGVHPLVVEDIIDTGLTMKFLLENLGARHPASIKVCTLLEKPARAKTKVPIDYKGFVIEDKFVVGYGLDYGEKYRNLPFIGVMRSE